MGLNFSNTIRSFALLLFLSSCSTANNGSLATGVPVVPNTDTLTTTTANQSLALAQLQERAGLTSAPNGADWFLVLKAGMEYSDTQCSMFIEALHRFDRDSQAATRSIALGGSTTSAILGVASASAPAIAITSAAFGFIAEAFSISSDSILFKAKPSVILTLVKKAQERYREAIALQEATYDNRPDMMSAWAEYHKLCLPTFIEAQIEEAAVQTEYVAINTGSGAPELRRVGGQTGLSQSQLREFEERGRRIFGEVMPSSAIAADERIAGCDENAGECNLSRTQALTIQRNLCITDDAQFGLETRNAFRLVNAAIDARENGTFSADHATVLNNRRYSFVLGIKTPCSEANADFANAFERLYYGEQGAESEYTNARRASVVKLKRLINIRLNEAGQPVPALNETDVFDDALRAAVGALNDGDEEITPTFLQKISR